MFNKENLENLNVRATLFELEGLMNGYSKIINGRVNADNGIKEHSREMIKFYCKTICEWTDALQRLDSSNE